MTGAASTLVAAAFIFMLSMIAALISFFAKGITTELKNLTKRFDRHEAWHMLKGDRVIVKDELEDHNDTDD